MEKVWSDEAWDDYLYWQGQDKKTLRKINTLIKDRENLQHPCLKKNLFFATIFFNPILASEAPEMNVSGVFAPLIAPAQF